MTSFDLPKNDVSLKDCNAFLEEVNNSYPNYRYRFRLPTPSEFALSCGNPASYSADITHYAWLSANSSPKPNNVAQKKPFPTGLYDILGNLWERTDDGRFYGLASDSVFDLKLAFASVPLPSSFRGEPGDFKSWNVGFRVAAGLK